MNRPLTSIAAVALVAAACSSSGSVPTTAAEPEPTVAAAPTTTARAVTPATTSPPVVADVSPDRAFCQSLEALVANRLGTASAHDTARGLLDTMRMTAPDEISSPVAVFAADLETLMTAIEQVDFDMESLVTPEYDAEAQSAIVDWSRTGCRPQLSDVSASWTTNFDQRTIELDELIVGVATYTNSRDLIQPLDLPAFVTVEEAQTWLDDREPGVMVELEGEVRFYPIQILTAHEIVNDAFGSRSVGVTYCPLCNSAVVFDRTVEGQVLRFGTSGLLRNSDLVMWDDATESLWQQITGEAIVGDLAGTSLEFLPSAIVRWGDFAATFPGGQVLSRETGFPVDYGFNSYVGYSSLESPNRFTGELDDRLPALERVVGVIVGDAAKAYPFSLLSTEGAVNDDVAGVPIVVMWGSEDTADPLDARFIAQGRSIGTAVAFERSLDGQALHFRPENGGFVDDETGSTWDLFGRATSGELAGARLTPAIHRNEFWFAWAAFNEGQALYEGS